MDLQKHQKYMVLKADKSHFLIPEISLNDTISENVTEVNVLEIVIYDKQSFKFSLKNICKKVDQKLNALSIISKLTTFNLT